MRDFTSGSATKQILLFSLPMLIGNVFQQFYSMVDAIVVGNYVSPHALASVGVAMNVLQFMLAALIGLTTGASVIISQFYGAKQLDRLARTVSTSAMFLAGLSVLLAVLGVALTPAILRLLNTDPLLFDDAALYLRILMGGTVFPVFYNMYTAYLRALGDSRNPLYILICCTVLNTGLDLLFVLVFRLGVLGVAVATVIAQAVSALLCWGYVHKRVALLRIKKFVFDFALFRAVLKYGFPAALQLSLVSLANLTITRLINSFGPDAMSGITAAVKVDQLAIMPVSTFSLALASFVAQNMGAGQEARARKGFRSSLLFMVALAVCISGLLILFGPQLISLFLDKNEAGTAEILEVGINYLNIMVVFYFLFAFLFAFNGFFRGAGDAVIAMVFPVVSLTVRTVSAHMLVSWAGMRTEALAWSIPIGWGLSSLASFVYYRKRLWAGKTVSNEKLTIDN
ncbi:MAG: MATE family efflux transporter [Oscillospiraceae bacterium]|nr:MATE family efflux transporter [Oscillospiraceae bacterium]